MDSKNHSSNAIDTQNHTITGLRTENEKLKRDNAELTSDRVELLKRVERLEGDIKSLQSIRNMDQDEFQQKLKLADERVASWRQSVEHNAQEIRRNLRMLVDVAGQNIT